MSININDLMSFESVRWFRVRLEGQTNQEWDFFLTDPAVEQLVGDSRVDKVHFYAIEGSPQCGEDDERVHDKYGREFYYFLEDLSRRAEAFWPEGACQHGDALDVEVKVENGKLVVDQVIHQKIMYNYDDKTKNTQF